MRSSTTKCPLSLLAGLGLSSPAWALDGDLSFPDADDAYPNAGTVVLVAKDVPAYPTTGQPDVFTHCSGSLIGQNLYLTARHCTGPIERWLPDYDLYVTLDREPMEGLGVLDPDTRLIGVTEIIKAPNVGTEVIDLAVLVLERPAKDAYPEVKPVYVASDGLLDEIYAEGGDWTMTIASYGRTGACEEWLDHPNPGGKECWSDQKFGSRRLLEAPYLSTGSWFGLLDYSVYDRKPIGGGDSGSPIFWENPANGEQIQVLALRGAKTSLEAVVGVRLDRPLSQAFLDCVMVPDTERDACLDAYYTCITLPDGEEREDCLADLPS